MAADAFKIGDKKEVSIWKDLLRIAPARKILFILLCVHVLETISAFPSKNSVVRRLFNVTRVYNAGDLFSNIKFRCLPSYCSRLGTISEPDLHCSCRCPINKPIFLQNTQNCTDTIDVCHKVLEFRSENETLKKAPTLFLPLQNQILNPGAQLNWREAGIKLNRKGKAPCEAKIGGILTEQGWIILHKKLFKLHVVNAGTFFKWLGNEDDGRYLEGKLVQIPLVCSGKRGRKTEHMCAAFRVIGNDKMVKPLPYKSESPSRGLTRQPPKSDQSERNETGLIVGIVCGALLALTLVGVAIFWVVCWKHQKDKLIRRIQMQFLYQAQRFPQQNGNVYHAGPSYGPSHEPMVVSATALEMHHMSAAGSLSGNEIYQMTHSNGWIVPGSVAGGGALEYDSGLPQSIDHLPPPPPYPTNLKKKLYFSPEFFDPELMVDPPPLAEEFLYEVRRMIDLAKTRLRARRYMPRIPVIPEENSSVGGDSSHHSGGSEHRMVHSAIQEESEEDMLEMEEIVGIVSLSSPGDLGEEEDDENERKSPDGSGGSTESPDSGKTSGDGPTSSDVSKESTEKDSGIEDLPAAKYLKPDGSSSGVTQEKVTHWLSRMPEESLDIEESPPPPRKPVRHSKLFKYFAARQSQVHAANPQGFPTIMEDKKTPSSSLSQEAGDGVFRLTVDNDESGENTGRNLRLSPSEEVSAGNHSSSLLKRYGINTTQSPRTHFQPTFEKDLWLKRNPEYISRQQILNNHKTSGGSVYAPMSPPIYGNNSGVSVASLPRQFMRQQLQQTAGTLTFPSDRSLPFADSFPRINPAKYCKSRPEIQAETYSDSFSSTSSMPPASILPSSSQQSSI